MPDSIKRESDLIEYIRSGGELSYGGVPYRHTTKDKLGPLNRVLVNGYYFYNKVWGLIRFRKRVKELKKKDLTLPTKEALQKNGQLRSA